MSLAINEIDEVAVNVDIVCGVLYCKNMEKVDDDDDVNDKKCLHDNKKSLLSSYSFRAFLFNKESDISKKRDEEVNLTLKN